MKVKELMTANVYACRATDTADVAAALMWEHDIGAVPIVDPEFGVIGMVTDRDLAMASHLQFRKLSEIEVGSVMSPHVHTTTAEARITDAERTMRAHQVRRLPVLDDSKLVGILSLNDLARAASLGWRKYAHPDLVETLAAVSAPRRRQKEGPEAVVGMDALRQMRDELRVQVHLAQADAKDEWEKAEAGWQRLQSRLSVLEDKSVAATKAVGKSLQDLGKEINEGYSKVRDSL